MSSVRKLQLAGLIAAVATAAVVVALLAGENGGSSGNAKTPFSPAVVHTGTAPTGYTVTFRYRDRSAKSVQLVGEWYFSTPGHTRIGASQGLRPPHWKPGDFAIGWPDTATTAGWPVVEMKEDRRTGVWSYTTPLPSGEFNYGFFLNCPSVVGANPNLTACVETSDPSNPPWNDHHGVSVGSVEATSQVYVPSDPAFHTVDYSWEAPTSPRGALRDVAYPPGAATAAALASPVTKPRADDRLAIYTPPGYDPQRATPYPTLYLSGGARSSEVPWSTQADAGNILDNVIDRHEIEPIVVVMTNYAYSGDCLTDDQTIYSSDLLGSVIPYVQSHYDVSKEPLQRAFAGLSCGGGAAAFLLADDTRMFGSIGVFSPFPAYAPSPAAARAIEHVGVMVGGGLQDPIHSDAVQEVKGLQGAGDKVVTDFVNGGHDWFVWRVLLRDFLTRVAFKPVAG